MNIVSKYRRCHELASKTDNQLNKTLNWSNDSVVQVICKIDYQNDITTYQYDSTNRLVALKNAAYLQVSYHYDGAGRLLNRILSNGAQYTVGSYVTCIMATHTYDAADRRISSTDILGYTTTFHYDMNGNLIATTDANCHTKNDGMVEQHGIGNALSRYH